MWLSPYVLPLFVRGVVTVADMRRLGSLSCFGGREDDMSVRCDQRLDLLRWLTINAYRGGTSILTIFYSALTLSKYIVNRDAIESGRAGRASMSYPTLVLTMLHSDVIAAVHEGFLDEDTLWAMYHQITEPEGAPRYSNESVLECMIGNEGSWSALDRRGSVAGQRIIVTSGGLLGCYMRVFRRVTPDCLQMLAYMDRKSIERTVQAASNWNSGGGGKMSLSQFAAFLAAAGVRPVAPSRPPQGASRKRSAPDVIDDEEEEEKEGPEADSEQDAENGPARKKQK